MTSDGKKKIDIEVLLQWVYGWELLKCPDAPPPMVMPWDMIERLNELQSHQVSDGRPTDYSHERGHGGSSPYLDPKYGGPHPDALYVKAVVDCLPAEAQAWLWPDDRNVLAPDMPKQMDIADDKQQLVPDYNRTLINLRLEPKVLITRHAMLKTRPDAADVPMPEKIESTKSRHPVMVGERYRSGEWSDGSHCPMQYFPTPTDVIKERMAYATWHASMEKVAAELAGKLIAHETESPRAPAKPWAGEVEQKPTVLKSNIIPSMSRLPLVPKRKAPLPPIQVGNSNVRTLKHGDR